MEGSGLQVSMKTPDRQRPGRNRLSLRQPASQSEAATLDPDTGGDHFSYDRDRGGIGIGVGKSDDPEVYLQNNFWDGRLGKSAKVTTENVTMDDIQTSRSSKRAFPATELFHKSFLQGCSSLVFFCCCFLSYSFILFCFGSS